MGEPVSLSSIIVREQLSRILASRVLFRAAYLRHFLNVCVSETLDGNSGALKELWLASEVFGRRGDFNPGLDPIVRVQARRLRDKLALFYRSEGSADDVRITLPVGSYVPFFSTTAHGRQNTVPRSGKLTIAVVPFRALTDCPSTIHVAGRVSAELSEALATCSGLHVCTRSSLQADCLISGTVRGTSDGNQVRLEMAAGQPRQLCWSAWFEQGNSRCYPKVQRVALLLREELCGWKDSSKETPEATGVSRASI